MIHAGQWYCYPKSLSVVCSIRVLLQVSNVGLQAHIPVHDVNYAWLIIFASLFSFEGCEEFDLEYELKLRGLSAWATLTSDLTYK
jgi:hypothetical protein